MARHAVALATLIPLALLCGACSNAQPAGETNDPEPKSTPGSSAAPSERVADQQRPTVRPEERPKDASRRTTAAPAVPTTPCDQSRIETCFGPLEKIAGKGELRRRGQNGWKPEFEGKSALAAELSRPHFAMADDAGNIYIADKDAHAIRRIDGAGNITTVAGTGRSGFGGDTAGPATKSRLSYPNGLWVRGDGTLYILDLGNERVRRVGTDGAMTTLFRVQGGISIGRGLWVSDDEKRAFVASGRRLLSWQAGSKPRVHASGFRSLGTLVVGSKGHVVAADRVAGRVYSVDPSGAKTVLAGNGQTSGGGDGKLATASSLPGVRAVWLDPRGGMFLGTHESNSLWYVSKDGILQRMFADSTLDELRGVSLDRAGNLIIVDDDHGFVRRAVRR